MTWLEWLISLWHKTPVDGDMLTLHNAARTKPLILNDRLVKMAQEHAQDMASEGRQNHDNFVQRLLKSGYLYRSAEENVTARPDVRSAWQSWVDSPKHYANAINPKMQDVGFGSAIARDGQTYWCAVYGQRQ